MVVVSSEITDQQETGKELNTMCFASAAVTGSPESTVEVNRLS